MEITNHMCSSNIGNVPYLEESKSKVLVALNLQVYRKAVERLIPKRSQDIWIRQIENGNDDPLKALLILLSPNMKSIDWEAHNAYGWTAGCEDEKA